MKSRILELLCIDTSTHHKFLATTTTVLLLYTTAYYSSSHEKKTYVLNAGSALIIPPKVAYIISPIVNDGIAPLSVDLLITNELINETKLPFLANSQPPLDANSTSPPHWCDYKKSSNFTSDNSQSISAVVNRLIYAYHDSQFTLNDNCFGAILMLFNRLDIASTNASKQSEFEQKIHEIIEENLSSITVELAAEKLGYSSGYLSRRLKKETHHTFVELVTDARLNATQDYLSRTDYSTEHIAGLVGYSSASYLYKIFSKRFHITPAQYRKLFTETEFADTLRSQNL